MITLSLGFYKCNPVVMKFFTTDIYYSRIIILVPMTWPYCIETLHYSEAVTVSIPIFQCTNYKKHYKKPENSFHGNVGKGPSLLLNVIILSILNPLKESQVNNIR